VWDGASVWHSGGQKDKGETVFQLPPGIAAKEGFKAQLEAPCLPIPLGMGTLRMIG
jgi:hypothetical protein